MSGLGNTKSTISRDHPCWKCGYNLRGLSDESRCPECGEAIDLTKQPRRAAWRVALQGTLVFLACLAIAVLAVGTLLFDSLVPTTGYPQYVWTVGALAAVVALPVWWWTRNRVLAITFTGFVLVLLFLPFVRLITAGPYNNFYKHIHNGMTQREVLDRLDTYFPNRASEGRPSITRQNTKLLVMVLDPNDGLYNCELIVVEFEDDRVVSKLYSPD